MDHVPSQSSVSHKIPHLVRNLNHIHKVPPIIYTKIYIILIFAYKLRLGFASGIFVSVVLIKVYCGFLMSLTRATCSDDLIFINVIALISD